MPNTYTYLVFYLIIISGIAAVVRLQRGSLEPTLYTRTLCYNGFMVYRRRDLLARVMNYIVFNIAFTYVEARLFKNYY